MKTQLLFLAVGAIIGIVAARFGGSSAPPAPTQAPNTSLTASEQDLFRQFHINYYDQSARTWEDTRWLGVKTLKLPLDLWIYQEMLYELKPDVIVECGTFEGGSAFFLATIMDALGKGRIITIDIETKPNLPKHPRIQYLNGSSTSPPIAALVRSSIRPGETVIVLLDSDHSKDHVLAELRTYSPLVSVGSYIVVEDTNINGHPVKPDFGPGPMEALEAFLAENKAFVPDPKREKFGITFNPRGYLRRVR